MADSRLTRGAAARHLRAMATPAAAGLLCNTLFNMTDTFYAGWLGTDAQAALTFAFPLYFAQLSLSVGVLQATTARTAKALGGKKTVRARWLTGQSLSLAALASLLVWMTFLPGTDGMLSALGADGRIREWAGDYIRVIFIGAPAFMLAFAVNGALHAAGNTTAFRNSIAVATAVNVILDPALMFGWFGLPALGVAGVGWATVIAQGGCGLYMAWSLSKTVLMRQWRWKFLLPCRRLLWDLTATAMTPAGRMLCINLGFFIVIFFLGFFDGDTVAGYGIALRLEQLFLLPTIGLEAAMLSYAGQNLGGGRRARIAAAYFLCLKNGWKVMAVGALTMLLFGAFLVGLFNESEAVIAHGRQYLFAAAASGPFYVMINVAGAVFLAAGRRKTLLGITVLRLIVAPAALCYLLIERAEVGVWGVWLSVFLCAAAAALFMHRHFLQLASRGYG